MAELLYRLGRTAARRSGRVIAAWLLLLALAATGFVVGGGTLATGLSIPGTPTAEVTERLQSSFPEAAGGTGTVVLTTTEGTPFTPQQQEAVGALIATATEVDGVEQVIDPFATEAMRAGQAQQITEGRAQLDAAAEQAAQGQAQLDAARALAGGPDAPAAVAAELDAQQAALDAGAAELEAQTEALELSTQMLAMAEGIRTVSEDGTAALVMVTFTESAFDVPDETTEAVVAAFEATPVDGVDVHFSADIATGIPELLGVGEVVGLVVAAIVLLVMLRTLVTAALPILTALVGVGIGALSSLSLSGVVEMVSVTPILGVMLGLAVGIDYSLFIINRHRRQLKVGLDVHESIGLANGTSGNAVVFAGATVLIALAALNITGIPFLGLMGTIGALCVAIAVLVAVTLTPALLGLLGTRVLTRRERAAAARAAERAASAQAAATEAVATEAVAPVRAMRTPRAVAHAVIGVAVLALLAVPAASLRIGLPDGATEAPESTQYQAYSTISDRFGAGANGTLLVVADLPDGADETRALGVQVQVAQALYAHEDVVAVAPIGASADGTMTAFQVIPSDGPNSEATEDLVHDLRELTPVNGQIPIAVAGAASGNIDISDKLNDALPFYLAVVVGLSLLIMVVVFRSVFVPVIATGGFILSYFAAIGGVVAIYQWGWLGGLFGVHHPGPVLNFLPTILVGILFGLAMDYMLFIGSGMREAYAHGVPARVAVVQGMRAGRTVVTAAAIIMISVFGGFMFSDSAMIRPIGFALAFGVLVDAFLVRMLIVPALMHLAGDHAWWLPRWLDRLLPDVDVEGSALERQHPQSAGADDAAPAQTVDARP